MTEDSVRKEMQEVNWQPRLALSPIPTIKPEVNIKNPANPEKKAELRIHGEDNFTFSSSDSDENPWANRMLPEWRPPPAGPPRVMTEFISPLAKG